MERVCLCVCVRAYAHAPGGTARRGEVPGHWLLDKELICLKRVETHLTVRLGFGGTHPCQQLVRSNTSRHWQPGRTLPKRVVRSGMRADIAQLYAPDAPRHSNQLVQNNPARVGFESESKIVLEALAVIRARSLRTCSSGVGS